MNVVMFHHPAESNTIMHTTQHKSKKQKSESAQEAAMKQKKALAAAILELGPSASAAALSRFMKRQFGVELTFGIAMPRSKGSMKKTQPVV